MLTIVSFLFFTILVAILTYLMTRKTEVESSDGYFLAGRSLTYPFIAGSLLLTNLSTEQLVGLNGAAFKDGLSVMVWEVWSVLAIVMMALYFLPRYLKSGISTIPEFLNMRYDKQTQVITNLIFLTAYMVILLPVVLYTGAKGFIAMLNVPELMGLKPGDVVLGLSTNQFTLVFVVWMGGIIGATYALCGGLKSVAISDTLNGVGLLTGGMMITYFGLLALGGDGGAAEGYKRFIESQPDRFNSVGSHTSSVPFETLFTGVLLIVSFYWTTNQQIIQRALAASSLAEGQKGVLLTGFLKLLGPFYLVIPGMIAFAMYGDKISDSSDAYGTLVKDVLPWWLTGFFAAAMVGAILSSFMSALNSTCTLFSLDLYKRILRPNAGDKEVVLSSTIFGIIVAVGAMLIAPNLEPAPVEAGQVAGKGIFHYLQRMNGLYFIPIFPVVLLGLLTKRVPPLAAKFSLLLGPIIIALGYFAPQFAPYVDVIGDFHFLAIVFVFLVAMMLLIRAVAPMKTPWIQPEAKVVDMTPWKFAAPAGFLLAATVIGIYVYFADLSVLKYGESTVPAEVLVPAVIE